MSVSCLAPLTPNNCRTPADPSSASSFGELHNCEFLDVLVDSSNGKKPELSGCFSGSMDREGNVAALDLTKLVLEKAFAPMAAKATTPNDILAIIIVECIHQSTFFDAKNHALQVTT